MSDPFTAPNRQISIAGASVTLAMPTHRDLSPYTVRSLLETQALCIQRGIGLSVELQAGSSLVHHARNKAAWLFLQSQNTHLFWIDSDIVWEGKDFLKFLALGTKMECVCGAYPAKLDPPTFFLSSDNPNDPVKANEWGCVPIGGVGMGFTIIQRSIMEQLAAKARPLRFPTIDEPIPAIFRCDDSNGEARGEDMAFFSDVRALGHTVWLDPNITMGHVGQKTYSASLKDHLIPQQ